MRRVSVFVSALAAALLVAGAQPAVASTTKTVELVRPISGQDVSGVCAFSVTVDQRDTRRVTTRTNGNNVVVSSKVRTKTSTTFTNRALGVVLDGMSENYVVISRHHRRGADTLVFVGEGALWGTDSSAGPFFLWVTGAVAMRGSYDLRTGFFTVGSKTLIGRSTDLCDSLTTGLKPRH